MSILEEAIKTLSNNHNLLPGIDSNKKRHQGEGVCPLSSGIEYSFVGAFCQEIFRRIPQENLPNYYQFFYIPNLKAEEKVGYDLSIGHYRQNNRIRTMHKVINEKYCDQSWSYLLKFANNKRGEIAGDYGHFIKLLNAHPEDLEQVGVQITSFLVINICYCIHDYRRMGVLFEHEQLTIPSFCSLLRTVIVDLRILKRQIDRQNIDVFSDQFYLKLSRLPEERLPNETPNDYISRIANKTNINIECCDRLIESQNAILSFDEFIQQIDWNSVLRDESN
jgi:hypothetical protein